MTGRLAILAGQGRLPVLLAESAPDALIVGYRGVPVDPALSPEYIARFEAFGALFETLHAAGVARVVFAGGLSRPRLDPARFDAATRAVAGRMAHAMAGGDDRLLGTVAAIFEEQGFAVQGAHEIRADLTVGAAPLVGAASDSDRADSLRAAEILRVTGPLDLGQGCVVADSLCLGIETAQGTEDLLRFVGQTRDRLRPGPGGVLVKQPKPGQNLRLDMPAIGPDTVDQAAAAGLTGIAVAAGHVLVLDRDRVAARAEAAGLAIWGME